MIKTRLFSSRKLIVSSRPISDFHYQHVIQTILTWCLPAVSKTQISGLLNEGYCISRGRNVVTTVPVGLGIVRNKDIAIRTSQHEQDNPVCNWHAKPHSSCQTSDQTIALCWCACYHSNPSRRCNHNTAISGYTGMIIQIERAAVEPPPPTVTFPGYLAM